MKRIEKGKATSVLFALLWITLFLLPNCFAAESPKAINTVKVGYLFDFTGPMAALGLGPEQKLAFDLFMEDHKASGGFMVGGKKCMIEPVIYDDKGVAEGVREATNRLVVRDGVKFIAWEMTDSGILAMHPIIQQNQVLTIVAGGTKEILNPKITYCFRAYPPEAQIGPAMYDWLAKNMPQVKKIAVLTYDEAAGRAIGPMAREKAAKHGLEIVDVVLTPRAQRDFAAELTRIRNKNPDMIDTSCGPSALLIKQARDMGYNVPILNYAGFHPLAVTKTIGWNVLEGVISHAVNPDDTSLNLNPNFANYIRRVQKAGGQGGRWAFSVYNASSILVQAMEKANSLDPTKIRDVLETSEFNLIEGSKGRFGAKEIYGIGHQLLHPLYMSIVENGKVKNIALINLQ
jgi:branched-chain amino acid transport system substrate-binding protein